ncbi:GrpB family protein [Caenimonas terrae]|uniref:GrpB family protein n=1 Tax=Caenimonas terrae TaxID=696074 RepID=A0ABW0ND44_9BURK
MLIISNAKPHRAAALDDAPIEIAEYNPRWVEAFQLERDVLGVALAPWLVGGPEHIGSTAVPGLAAKPIIDIMAQVLSLEDSRGAIAAAAGAGYVYFPYRAEAMHWFCKPSPSMRTHHLHLVPRGSRLWNERLAFRDALRADEALRAEYRDLKVALAARFRHDRDGYTDAKLLLSIEFSRAQGKAMHMRSNRSFDTDARMPPCASRPRLRAAGQLQR